MSNKSLLLTHIREKLLQWRAHHQRWRAGEQLFLIYSMGKVGTTTVYSLLKAQHPEYPIIQVHFMSDHWVKDILPKLDAGFHANISIAEEAYELIATHPNHRLKIITMVREPMLREVSDIFQNFREIFNVSTVSDLSFSQLRDYLDNCEHKFCLNWFENEFRSYVDFDVYNHYFDKIRGYSICRTSKADILIIRTESMNDSLVVGMHKFCGLKIKLNGSSNTTEQKEGKELYFKLVKEYTPTLEKLKLLYNSRLVRHFYTEAEIDGFIKRWSHGKFNLYDLYS